MVVRVPTINTGQPPGDRFPDVVADEVRELIGEHSDGWLINPFYRDLSRVEVPAPRILCTGSVTPAAGELRMGLFTPRADITVEAIVTISLDGSTHTGATDCRLGLFHVDTPEGGFYPMALVARTAHVASRWDGAGVDTAAIADDGAETPATITEITLQAGVRYGVGLLSVGHTGTISLAALGGYRPEELDPPVGFTLGSQTGLPLTIPSGGAVAEGAVPWFGLKLAED